MVRVKLLSEALTSMCLEKQNDKKNSRIIIPSKTIKKRKKMPSVKKIKFCLWKEEISEKFRNLTQGEVSVFCAELWKLHTKGITDFDIHEVYKAMKKGPY